MLSRPVPAPKTFPPDSHSQSVVEPSHPQVLNVEQRAYNEVGRAEGGALRAVHEKEPERHGGGADDPRHHASRDNSGQRFGGGFVEGVTVPPLPIRYRRPQRTLGKPTFAAEMPISRCPPK
jgi:hypothetical protein